MSDLIERLENKIMWIMTFKKHRGNESSAPYVEIKLGEVTIAEIAMISGRQGGPWVFYLKTQAAPEKFPSFGEALRELHRRLNSPPPEGFETHMKKGATK